MVNDLRELLAQTSAAPPHDDLDLQYVLTAGRRRVRRRRAAALGGAALATVAVVGVGGGLAVLERGPSDITPAGVPRPDAPTLRLSQARAAAEGTDYRVLVTHTNENLNRDNGQYFDGVTPDGLILFRDGPRLDQPRPRFALLAPATGEKDWLPNLAIGEQAQILPLDLGEDRLVLLTAEWRGGLMKADLVAYVFDRGARRWSRMTWPELPRSEGPAGPVVGPDDRLYVPVLATRGQPPEGGWPIGVDGEADDADAEGSTYRLWSASLTDSSDVRDEGLTVGSIAFTDTAMVWTDSSGGDAGNVHVRNLINGEERSFDPNSGERCNLLSFGVTEEHIAMGQYCGTYEDGIRDDRIQVLDHEGNQVVTMQGSGLDGGLSASGLVTVTSRETGSAGTYVYDPDSGEFLRISGSVSSWATGGPTPKGQFLWNSPVNNNKGMTQYVGELVD